MSSPCFYIWYLHALWRPYSATVTEPIWHLLQPRSNRTCTSLLHNMGQALASFSWDIQCEWWQHQIRFATADCRSGPGAGLQVLEHCRLACLTCLHCVLQHAGSQQCHPVKGGCQALAVLRHHCLGLHCSGLSSPANSRPVHGAEGTAGRCRGGHLPRYFVQQGAAADQCTPLRLVASSRSPSTRQ